MSDHDCLHQGHVWREGTRPSNPADYSQRPLYMRHRTTMSQSVSVFCQHCDATAELERKAGFSGHRAPGQPIDKRTPPHFQQVLDRAMAEAPQHSGPASKG